MSDLKSLKLLCIIALWPLESQEYTFQNSHHNTNEIEVLNRYNEMHTKDYGEFNSCS